MRFFRGISAKLQNSSESCLSNMLINFYAIGRSLFPINPHPEPLAVAEDGHDGVDGVESGVEVDAFVDVETGTHGIHEHPHNPLLDVFARQGPGGNDAHCRGESVGIGHVGVGEKHQPCGNQGVDGNKCPQCAEDYAPAHVAYG